MKEISPSLRPIVKFDYLDRASMIADQSNQFIGNKYYNAEDGIEYTLHAKTGSIDDYHDPAYGSNLVNKRVEFREDPWGNVHDSGDKIWYGFRYELIKYDLHEDTSLALNQAMSEAQGILFKRFIQTMQDSFREFQQEQSC